MKMINWKVSKEDCRIISKIAERAMKAADDAGIDYDYRTCDMDITACHLNGNPLRLAELLAADDFNFSHDVFGIRAHINRETGELMHCFSPRFSQPQNT